MRSTLPKDTVVTCGNEVLKYEHWVPFQKSFVLGFRIERRRGKFSCTFGQGATASITHIGSLEDVTRPFNPVVRANLQKLFTLSEVNFISVNEIGLPGAVGIIDETALHNPT